MSFRFIFLILLHVLVVKTMCGILAYLNINQWDIEQLKKMALDMLQTRLNHRGPDSYGLLESTCGGTTSLFGHARLAIMDPNGGIQPLVHTYPDGKRLILTVNGEIFNYKELVAETYSYTYKTASDCEVILALYDKIRDRVNTDIIIHELLERLDGQFSFVLHDESKNLTIVARDPFGITQLYCSSFDKGYIAIASELKALLPFSNTYTPDVFPAGHVGVYTHVEEYSSGIITPYFSETTLGSWQKRDYLDTSALTLDIEALKYSVRTIFEKSVSKRLMSDVPFAILLSGGLDSSLVASCAMRLRGSNDPPLHTFSVGIAGESPDLVAAKKVAEYLGTVHHEVHFTPEQGIAALEEIIWALETYDITTIRASTPAYFLSKSIRDAGFKMVLSGEGSDELWGSYLYFHKAPSDEEHQKECKMRLKELGYFDCLRADKTMLAHSIEVRVPFLDVAFVSRCVEIHKDVKTVGGLEKHLMRSAFNGYLPEDILMRQKNQFSDAVGSSWITKIRDFATSQIDNNVEFSLMWDNRAIEFPIMTPPTKEALYYRIIFERLFNKEYAKTVKYWIPNTRWDGVGADPSAHAQHGFQNA